MSREARRVPVDWEHPKDRRGHFLPMHETMPDYTEAEIEEGLRDGWLDACPPYYGLNVMPDWPDEQRTHLQMYETTTEGTPISPVMETPEKLARWLADNYATSFANRTASYEEWLNVCKGAWAPSAVVRDGVLMSGVEDTANKDRGDQ